ncbi:hypothetical protein BGX29_011850 [Mortierella sp. GBA35]|nr:hypothetical protein BGX29_011850 [Mortierella sp. GBA35]
MELDEAPAPTSRLDHLAELATSPTHANVHPPSSSPSSASSSSSSRPGQYTTHSHSQQHEDSSRQNRNHSHSHSQSRPHMIQQQLEAESGSGSGWSRSPITPTTTRKFNRMAIHEVLDGQNSPSFKRKGSPEEGSFSDPPTSSRHGSRVSSSRAYDHGHAPHHAHFAPSHQPHSPRLRQESPMPASNSEDDEDSDIRNYKKRRMLASSSTSSSSASHHHHSSNSNNHHHHHHHKSSPSSSSPNGGSGVSGATATGGAQTEVMDQVRNTLKLKQQQKAIIEARQGGSVGPLSASTPTTASSPPSNSTSTTTNNSSSNGNNSSSKLKDGANQPVTEKNPSGISVFHGSASFAAMNRRPLTSPKNPKNAKSLTIFAPSYSESSLSIRSAPLQPSHGHGIMSMNPRTSQPLRHQTSNQHQPHPLSHQHQATPTQQSHGSISQPLRSPKAAGHIRKLSRATLRAGPHTAGLDSSSGTLPAPILSSHTGPLPSPMYPHPNTPFHPSSHATLAAAAAAAASTGAGAAGGPPGHMSKALFMDTVSTLFDSVDSSRSLKYTLEEQIRKSAQLLQTLQSSGTMIESLVRGQFKELEKGVLDKFEGELEHLSARIRQLEEHQGLTPPPKKARTVFPTSSTSASTAVVTVSSQNAMTGVVSTSTSTSTLSSSSSSPKAGSSPLASSPLHHGSGSSVKDGMLPTPPLNKTQDSSAMEVEDEEELPTAPSESTTPPPQQDEASSSEYRSSVKKLQERVASLEKRQEPSSAATAVQA